VHVVVSVDADALAGCNGSSDRVDRPAHVPEHEGVVPGRPAGEEGLRRFGVVVAATSEDACRELAEPELACKLLHDVRPARFDRPTARVHGQPTVRGGSDGLDFRSFRAYDSRPMIRRVVILVAFVALACAAAPGAARMPTIPPGVIAGGVYVGDLTSEPARTQLEARFARPIPLVRGPHRWLASPQRLGAGAAIEAAVEQALTAKPGAEISVNVRWSRKKVTGFVDQLARGVDRAPVDA